MASKMTMEIPHKDRKKCDRSALVACNLISMIIKSVLKNNLRETDADVETHA